MTSPRDEYGLALDALLARYQTAAHRTFEREAAEVEAITENAIWEMTQNCAILDRSTPRPLIRL